MKRPTDLATMSHTIAEAAEGLDQRILARWAADCAERVLDRFEALHPHDERPRDAIAAARYWASGETAVAAARRAAFAAHAAARETDDAAARAAARAAGHAAATAHVAGHAIHAAAYAAKAMDAAAGADDGQAAARERTWQLQELRAASADARQQGE